MKNNFLVPGIITAKIVYPEDIVTGFKFMYNVNGWAQEKRPYQGLNKNEVLIFNEQTLRLTKGFDGGYYMALLGEIKKIKNYEQLERPNLGIVHFNNSYIEVKEIHSFVSVKDGSLEYKDKQDNFILRYKDQIFLIEECDKELILQILKKYIATEANNVTFDLVDINNPIFEVTGKFYIEDKKESFSVESLSLQTHEVPF